MFAVLFCLLAFITVFAFALYVFEVDLFKMAGGGGGAFFAFHTIFQNSVEQFYDTF